MNLRLVIENFMKVKHDDTNYLLLAILMMAFSTVCSSA